MKTGTIENRNSFLENVAAKLGRSRRSSGVAKPDWQTNPQWDVYRNSSQEGLADVLKKQCLLIHTQYIETDAAGLSEKVLHVINDYGAKSVVIPKDSRFGALGDYMALWKENGISVHEWNHKLGDENITACERADIGIAFSDLTLAESGTVVQFSSRDKGRSIHLLPKTYLCIVPLSTLVPRLTQAAEHIRNLLKNGEHLASCADFITGPSNSADIELNLIVGVHGPIKASYIVVTDL
ncbi:LutC/YkgG family protein [Metabacillus indicus]|uniref:LutC/YkgG family protein n=1 Tax=Metabacillus indicus TaxID=246786 RepID=UPI002491FC66|nr:lactate utilization protein C [Metabacillus indicus]